MLLFIVTSAYLLHPTKKEKIAISVIKECFKVQTKNLGPQWHCALHPCRGTSDTQQLFFVIQVSNENCRERRIILLCQLYLVSNYVIGFRPIGCDGVQAFEQVLYPCGRYQRLYYITISSRYYLVLYVSTYEPRGNE